MEPDTFMQETQEQHDISDVAELTNNQQMSTVVAESVNDYLSQLGGELPVNLYHLVLTQMERPLLEVVMTYTKNNQSRAAKLLGISRGTLRKKLAIYQIDNEEL